MLVRERIEAKQQLASPRSAEVEIAGEAPNPKQENHDAGGYQRVAHGKIDESHGHLT